MAAVRPESTGAAAICAILLPLGTGYTQEADEIVEVVGRTPLGAAIGSAGIPANVQQAGADEIAARQALDLTEFMQRNLAGVFVNEAQSNPLQPDVQYRGFVGSPLLGLSQGIAVYQDGVRLNEPFGDTVNWALLPESAIESLVLIPGSNPLFGLNALGGAISIQTRDGFNRPGTEVELSGGSFGRLGARLSAGGSRQGFGYFFTGEFLEEDGWRDFSPTEALQLFGKLDWRTEATTVGLGLAMAETELIGNGPAPVELLAIDRSAIFTRPDITENDLAQLNLQIEHRLGGQLTLNAEAYLRSSDIHTLNGDDSEFEACSDGSGFLCEADDDIEVPVFDLAGFPVVADDAVEGALINRTGTLQDGAGFGLQVQRRSTQGERRRDLVAGGVYDAGRIDFSAASELASLDATRLAVPGGIVVADSLTDLRADVSNLGLFIANTFGFGERLELSVSARYNNTDIVLKDRLGTELNGSHDFDRVNFAIGLTAAVAEGGSVYAGFSQSSRAPSPVELTCADPDDPCRLPNAFLADPPLEQVVAGTLEAGFRGATDGFDWQAGVFRTTSRDDIHFISAGALTGQGFFDNVGRTRRQGVETGISGGRDGEFVWSVNYTWLAATFRQHLVFTSPHNPAAIGDQIVVGPGDHLPLIPRNLLKAGFDWQVGSRLTAGASLVANSGFSLRGDESNASGQIGRAAVFNLTFRYELSEQVALKLKIDNLFDRQYETFGLFGEPDEVLGAAFTNPRFVSPAMPRAAWLGVQVSL